MKDQPPAPEKLAQREPAAPDKQWERSLLSAWRLWLSHAGGWLTSFPSRVFGIAAACNVLLTCLHLWLQDQPTSQEGTSGLVAWGEAFTSAWRRWDANAFLAIAHYGYTTTPKRAYFPLYPALIRLLSWPLGGHFTLAALLVSWLCCWGSYLWFYRLVEREYGERVARYALLFLACCPVSFFLFAPYSEAVFLLVSIGAIERARAGRFWQASALAALGVLSRPTGIILFVPLAWEWGRCTPAVLRLMARLNASFARRTRQTTQAQPPTSSSPARMGQQSTRLSRLALLSLTLIPLTLLSYMLYLKVATGNPLAFVASESLWGHHLAWPWNTAGLFVIAFQRAGQAGAADLFAINILDLLLVLPLPALVIYYTLRRRLLWTGAMLYHLGLTALLVAAPISPGNIPYEVLVSTERYILPAFPLFVLMGHFGAAHPRLYRVFLMVSVVILLLNTLRFLSGIFVA